MSGGQVIGVRTFGDALLGAIAPLGLAVAAGTALVVDLDADGPSYPAERTLAQVVAEGPRRAELVPERSGVAVLPNGGVRAFEALEMVEMLARSWPAVVVRAGSEPVPYPVVPVRPLWPGFMAPGGSRPAVWQRVAGAAADPPGPGPVLPAPGRRVVTALLRGRRPVRSAWVRAWRRVWELPWR